MSESPSGQARHRAQRAHGDCCQLGQHRAWRARASLVTSPPPGGSGPRSPRSTSARRASARSSRRRRCCPRARRLVLAAASASARQTTSTSGSAHDLADGTAISGEWLRDDLIIANDRIVASRAATEFLDATAQPAPGDYAFRASAAAVEVLGRHGSLLMPPRAFDPDRVAYFETEGWRAYYDHRGSGSCACSSSSATSSSACPGTRPCSPRTTSRAPRSPGCPSSTTRRRCCATTSASTAAPAATPACTFDPVARREAGAALQRRPPPPRRRRGQERAAADPGRAALRALRAVSRGRR